jgi:transmembrane sensor
MQVEVLGTHFNINAYENESTIKTTLVEGKVKIASGKQAATLLPGQQARISTNDMTLRL